MSGKSVSRAESAFWFEVYNRQREIQEYREMLMEDKRLDFSQFTVCVCLERWYPIVASAALKARIPLSRAGFLACVGMPIMTPGAAAELVANGLQVNGFSVMGFPAPSILAGGD